MGQSRLQRHQCPQGVGIHRPRRVLPQGHRGEGKGFAVRAGRRRAVQRVHQRRQGDDGRALCPQSGQQRRPHGQCDAQGGFLRLAQHL